VPKTFFVTNNQNNQSTNIS